MTDKVFCGIDLGTTNSVIATVDDGGVPRAIKIENDSAVVPSVVSIDDARDEVMVGRKALNRMAVFPRHTVRAVKRLMGQDITIDLSGRQFSPEEISSYILRYLVERAAAELGQAITDAVITVPAYFDDAQRRATMRAGQLAGLNVLRIINEPTAAALVYDHLERPGGGGKPARNILVYDLGGGTFDVSILEIKGEIKEVLASGGDTRLGGDDFDQRLQASFYDRLRELYDKVPQDDLRLRERFRDLAEKTKIRLSSEPYAQVDEGSLVVVDGKPFNLQMEVSRQDFQDMTRDLLQRTLDTVSDTLAEAHLAPEQIDEVILVGGCTRMPAVQEQLSAMFDQEILHSVDPDLCVAMGAAMQAALMAGEPLGHILLDVTAHSLGVKTLDSIDEATGDADHFSVIIRRNTRIPVTRSEVFYTVVPDQREVMMEVFQGESLSCRENTLIGRFDFALKPSPAATPVVTEFAYDLNGLVRVTVEQKGYNNRKTVTVDIEARRCIDPGEPVPGESDAGQGRPKASVPINYIVEKARRLAANRSVPGDVRQELMTRAERYEAAIRDQQSDESLIDELEDELFDTIEEAENSLSRDSE